ncbi:hypothetical protein EBZ80_01690 [bacterium]|nr:hypothetical protein [bacterium]
MTARYGHLTAILFILHGVFSFNAFAGREEAILSTLRKGVAQESRDEKSTIEFLRKTYAESTGTAKSVISLGLGAAYARTSPGTALQYISLARTGLIGRPEFAPVIAYYTALAKSRLGYHPESSEIAKAALSIPSLGDGWRRGLQSLLLANFATQRRDSEFLGTYESFVSDFPVTKVQQRLAARFARALDKRPLPQEFITAIEALSLSYPYSPEASWAFRRMLGLNCEDDPKARHFAPSRELLVMLGRVANLDEGVRPLVGSLLEGPVREKRRQARKLDPVDLIESLGRARLGEKALDLATDELEHARLWNDQRAEQRILPVLARIYYNQQDHLATDRILSQIREKYPDLYANSKIRELLADNYNRLGSHRLAADEFKLLSVRHSSNRQSRWQAFWALYRAGQFEEAANYLGSAASGGSMDGEDGADVKFWAARIRRSSDESAARALLEQLVERHGDSFYGIMASLELGRPLGSAALRVALPGNRMDTGSKRPRVLQFDPTQPIDKLKLVEILLEVRMVEAARLQMAGIAWDDQSVEESVVLGEFAFSVDNFRAGFSAANRLPREESPRPRSVRGLAEDRATRQVWRWLYPLAYPEVVDEFARQTGIDKYLILSIMRTESHYNPEAQSPVGAQGLMQIMPATAVRIARLLGDTTFNTSELRKPRISIAYGAYYLEKLLRFYGGNYGLAAAAYNAGPAVVNTWLESCPKCDMAEFVESIPFRETRLYVKTVVRNMVTYRSIYGGDPFSIEALTMPRSLPEGEILF